MAEASAGRPTRVDRIYEWMQFRATRGIRVFWGMVRLAWETLEALFRTIARRQFPYGEFISQCWFVIYVSIVPALLVTVPFGVVIALQIGSIAAEVGAQSFMGAANSLGVLQQAAPLVTALLLAGAAGSAICSDLGARKIREELDALRVMGISYVDRLVLPRVVAMVLIGVLLQALVAMGGLLTAYVFSVIINDATTGAYFASLNSMAQLSDFILGSIKAMCFGATSAIIAAYKGVNAGGGPRGVADAVNQTAVAAFLTLFATNVVLSQAYITFFPQRFN